MLRGIVNTMCSGCRYCRRRCYCLLFLLLFLLLLLLLLYHNRVHCRVSKQPTVTNCSVHTVVTEVSASPASPIRHKRTISPSHPSLLSGSALCTASLLPMVRTILETIASTTKLPPPLGCEYTNSCCISRCCRHDHLECHHERPPIAS